MHPILNIAVRAARSAGNIIVRYVNHIDSLNITTKGYNDFVSEVGFQRMGDIGPIELVRPARDGDPVLRLRSRRVAGRA